MPSVGRHECMRDTFIPLFFRERVGVRGFEKLTLRFIGPLILPVNGTYYCGPAYGCLRHGNRLTVDMSPCGRGGEVGVQ